MRISVIPAIALSTIVSCTTQREVAVQPSSSETASLTPALAMTPSATRVEAEPTSSPAPSARQDDFLTPSERAIFSSPAFRQRVLDSWVAETDVEPTIPEEERKKLVEVLDLIGKTPPDFDGAERVARSLRTPDCSASVDFMLAHVLGQQGKHSEAIPIYQAACDKFPRFRRAWTAMADAAIQANEFDNAVKAASRVIALGGGDGILWGILGIAHFKKERPLSAESAFRMAMALDPENGRWKQGLAESFFAQERFQDAIALLEQLIREHPDSTELWLAQGRAYANLENFERASENFEVVDRLGGANAETLNLLGAIYAKQELFNLSAKAFVRAFEKDRRGSISSAMNVARFMVGAEALDDVRMLLRGVEETRGDSLDKAEKQQVLRVRASLALASGNGGDEHAKILEELITLDPLDGKALILLGRHYAREEPQKAVDYFERAESIPEFAADAKIRHAEVLGREKRFAEGAQLLRAAQQIDKRESVEQLLKDFERLARTQAQKT
ncbi:MAG: tetratricopeptide repeat protein [Planctomycetes bacterium]|nr:tetratricopeptide repeat protein [Planctomycetota bacterium]